MQLETINQKSLQIVLLLLSIFSTPTEDLSSLTKTGMRTIKLNYAKTTFPRRMYWKLEFFVCVFLSHVSVGLYRQSRQDPFTALPHILLSVSRPVSGSFPLYIHICQAVCLSWVSVSKSCRWAEQKLLLRNIY